MHSINEKNDLMSENFSFLGKIINFQKFSIFSKSFGLILLVPLAYWNLLIRTRCSSYLEMRLRGIAQLVERTSGLLKNLGLILSWSKL